MAKNPENSELPNAGIEGQEPSLQIEVTPQQAEQINAALASVVASLKANAPENAERAAKPLHPADREVLDDLNAGMPEELLS